MLELNPVFTTSKGAEEANGDGKKLTNFTSDRFEAFFDMPRVEGGYVYEMLVRAQPVIQTNFILSQGSTVFGLVDSTGSGRFVPTPGQSITPGPG